MMRQKKIPHSRPYLGNAEIEAVERVILSGHIAQGEEVGRFEQAFALNYGLGCGAATSSGTAALQLSLLAVGVQKDDEVIIPSYVCTALLHAVRAVRAIPVIADANPITFNIDPDDVEKRITDKTRAIIVPHMFGLPADMYRLVTFDIPVVEDCAQAVGGKLEGQSVGTFGSAAVFSFYATKMMTTGEGGMVTSKSRDVIDRVKDRREYDKKNDDKLRFNYKMSDIQAALGLSQMKRLEGFISRRREIAKRYAEAFNAFNFMVPVDAPEHIYFRFVIKLEKKSEATDWIQKLEVKGVQCERPVFKPIHQYLGLAGYLQSDELIRRLISIPIYPMLSDEEVERIIVAVSETYEELAGEV